MEGDEERYSNRSKERADLVIIFVVASLALTALFVALSYYCYISNKLSKRRSLNLPQFTHSQLLLLFLFLLFLVNDMDQSCIHTSPTNKKKVTTIFLENTFGICSALLNILTVFNFAHTFAVTTHCYSWKLLFMMLLLYY